jgi:hypothetical protein
MRPSRNLSPSTSSRPLKVLLAALIAVLAVLVAPPVSADEKPDRIPLPNGFSPEDITAGPGHTFFVGSLSTGGIYEGSFRTGRGSLLVPSATGPTTGLYLERAHGHDRLWAAGGPSGQARVYDARTGALLRTYQLADPSSGTFVSDVVVTHDAAYYTDSFVQRLFVIPLGRQGGHDLPGQEAVRTVPLTGDVAYVPGSFNLNGLAAVGDEIVSAQTVTGRLFRIDPSTGVTREIPLTDEAGNATTVPGADGVAQRGHTLFAAQNIPEKIATIRLRSDLRTARVVDVVSDPALDIPSSVERDGGDLFALNARFTTPPGPATTYDIVRVDR